MSIEIPLNLNIENSIIKQSLVKLVHLYNNQNEPQNELKESNDLKLSYIKSNTNEFIKTNFCDEKCFEGFQAILSKLNKGEIDINSIDWTKGGQNNIIQNLVNFYYNIGYNQAVLDQKNEQ